MPKIVVLSLMTILVLLSLELAEAQKKNKIPRIGVLEPGFATSQGGTCNNGFRQGLRDLGYIEGRNIDLQTRYAESKFDRLPTLASELVELKPDIIWTHSLPLIRAVMHATTTIPVVLGGSRDVVELEIVSSLARPGGNITGMELRDSEIFGKRLELLKETAPKIFRVAILAVPSDPGHAFIPGSIEKEARALRVQLQRVEVSGSEGLDKAFEAIAQSRSDALLLPESALLSQLRHRTSELAISKRLPTAAGGPHFAEGGMLFAYGASVRDVCLRSAHFIDKILKGANPADLPVERPAKFEFVINLKTAKQIGLPIPPAVLARADRVIRQHC